MPTTTAMTNNLEAELLNTTLRGTARTATGGATLYIALMTNVTADGSLAENASGAGYTSRIAMTATTSQCFGVGGVAATPATAGSAGLSNCNAVTFTAGGTITIAGIAVCTSPTISGTASTDTSILYYGDITGGSVTLGSTQTITFAANNITISLE
jgi:hypothetical protein